LNVTGESTDTNYECQKIAEIIREIRGLGSPDDDCGHIIAKQYGGKVVDYNLFPQDMKVNRGWGIATRIWKWGVELFVRIWLIYQAEHDPMVRVRVRLFYPNPGPDTQKPDRPISLHVHLQFYKRPRKDASESSNETTSNSTALSLFIRTAIYLEVPNESLQADESKTKDSMRAFCAHLKRLQAMASTAEARKLLEIYAGELDRFLSPPAVEQPSSSSRPTPMSANKPFSWWDIVPVVGSIRTLDDAVNCGKEGDEIGATINGILGRY
jgi:hypothetical protein